MDTIGLKHWKISEKENGIFWLTFDKADSTANTLNEEVLREFHTLLKNISQRNPKGLVIHSGKSAGFIAGADIQQFKQFHNSEEAYDLIRQGQLILNDLADLPFPTVAVIHGDCLGGGFELALACRYRVVEEDPKTKLALPEVMLGIHPGWGGTIRLPHLIGGPKAMELVLTGKPISARAAYKMGIADACVAKWDLERAANYFIQVKPKSKKPGWIEKFTNLELIRPLVGYFIRRKLQDKINPAHYPAPYMALDQWIKHGDSGDEAYVAEARSISQLFLSDTSKNLVRVFDLQRKLKGLAKHSPYNPTHLHVIGAGVMGGDIAALAASKGMKVTLQDQNHEAIAKAMARAKTFFQKKLKESHRVNAAMDRLQADPKGYGIPQADILLEAIVEEVGAKQQLFAKLETEAKPTAIFATNTSTLPIEEIAKGLSSREKLIGIHFFNPVPKMPLVEVVMGEETSEDTLQHAYAFVKKIDKLPVPVKSVPGFLVNRVLMPYLLESVLLLEEGIPAPAIDQAMIDFGMPMGPIELVDLIGLDVCLKGAHRLFQTYEGEIPKQVIQKVAEGNYGKKTGRGFYRYESGKIIKEKLDPNYRIPDDVVDRLVLRMINECLKCLREGVVADADLLDAGMIFGAGFPPFRGGPIHYVTNQEENLLLQRMKLLTERYGDRFQADHGWNMINAA